MKLHPHLKSYTPHATPPDAPENGDWGINGTCFRLSDGTQKILLGPCRIELRQTISHVIYIILKLQFDYIMHVSKRTPVVMKCIFECNQIPECRMETTILVMQDVYTFVEKVWNMRD